MVKEREISKVSQFLLPIISFYPYEFLRDFMRMNRVGHYIFDDSEVRRRLYPENKLEDKYLYVLVDVSTKLNKDLYQSFLDTAEEFEVEVFSYQIKPGLEMVAVKPPESHIETFNKFLESKYSEMYSKKDLYEIYGEEMAGNTGIEEADKAYRILSKDPKAEDYLIEEIKEVFGTKLTRGDLKGEIKEYSLPLVLTEEIYYGE